MIWGTEHLISKHKGPMENLGDDVLLQRILVEGRRGQVQRQHEKGNALHVVSQLPVRARLRRLPRARLCCDLELTLRIPSRAQVKHEAMSFAASS